MNNLKVIDKREMLNHNFEMYGTFDDPMFLAKDVAEWIEYDPDKVGQMLNAVDSDEKLTATIYRSGQNREMWFLTEDGLYEVLMQSRKPIAKKFKAEVKKLLKSLRKGETVILPAAEAERLKLEAQRERSKAMLLNAQNRTLKTIMGTIGDQKLSAIAVEVFGLKAIESMTGVNMGKYLPETKPTYSATEIGERLGISSAMVGRIANKHNLKTDEYGITVMDKSRHSSKEMPSFRYYDNVVPVFEEFVGKAVSNGD